MASEMNAFSALPGGGGEAMDTVHRSCRHFLIWERELSDPSQWRDKKKKEKGESEKRDGRGAWKTKTRKQQKQRKTKGDRKSENVIVFLISTTGGGS